MLKPSLYFLLAATLFLFACSNGEDYREYEHWKVNDWNGFSYLRSRPREVTVRNFILLTDTTLQGSGQPLDTGFTRFDKEGRVAYFRKWDGASMQEENYFFPDEGLVQQSVLTHTEGQQLLHDTLKIRRTRIGDRSFVLDYFSGSSQFQTDSVFFGKEEDVHLVRQRHSSPDNIIPAYMLVTWYSNDRPAKDESIDTYGRNGHLYHRDARGNLESVSYSNPAEKEVFVNNPQGDAVLFYHTIGLDTVQVERNQYLYDNKGNWTRRLTWKKNLEPPVVFEKEFAFAHYTLTVRSFQY